uniref:(northern house mosquito) hypothetical protein n=1 Tax=Culex pipiens TaxID=7175 RepID=A0A8D7ZSK6_CULPI
MAPLASPSVRIFSEFFFSFSSKTLLGREQHGRASAFIGPLEEITRVVASAIRRQPEDKSHLGHGAGGFQGRRYQEPVPETGTRDAATVYHLFINCSDCPSFVGFLCGNLKMRKKSCVVRKNRSCEMF